MSTTTVSGAQEFVVPAQAAYETMLDPAQTAAALPGCEEYRQVGPEQYVVRLAVNLIAFTANVSGEVTITDRVPPRTWRVLVTGSGSLGSLEIEARMRLEDTDAGCRLHYDVDIHAHGQIGAVAGPVLSPAAHLILGQYLGKMAEQAAAHPGR